MNKVIIKTILCIPAALFTVFVPLFLITIDAIGAFMSDFGDNPTPRSENPLVAVYPSIFIGLLMAWLIYSIYKESHTALHLNLMLSYFFGFLFSLRYFFKIDSYKPILDFSDITNFTQSNSYYLLMIILIVIFIIVFTGLTMRVVNSDSTDS